jgi:hypothetical protein
VPGFGRAYRLDHDVGPRALAGLGPELAGELAPLRAAADRDDVRAGVPRRGAQHQPDRPRAEHGDGLAALDPRALDAAQAAGERLDHGGDLGSEPLRDGQKVALGDSGRHQQELGIRAVEERLQVLAERLLAAGARRALPARRRVGCHHPPSGGDVGPAELVPERAGDIRQQERVAAAEGLRVGAVGERDLDLDEHVAGPRHGLRHLLHPQVAGAVVAEGPHGVKTTLTASWER